MTRQGFAVGPRPMDGKIEMFVKGPWSAEAGAAFGAASAESLVLNYAHGFDETDLEFVRGLAVRQLTILDRRLPSLEPIYDLAPTLESLSLEVDGSLMLDLERLPHLTELACNWGQIKKSFAGAVGLRRLYAGKYTEATLEPLTVATGLQFIVMKDRPSLRSLDGLGDLSDIQQLEIYRASKLTDTGALRLAPGLQELQLQTCRKIATMDDVALCADLTFLNLSEGAEFPSAEPLRGLKKLLDLYLYDTTRFTDGDLSPIAELPLLRDFRMMNRKHYRPSAEEIKQNIAARQG
ncbi:hypothetical protein ACFVWG_29860 [Kribbella sp. NPDC058245]|uniref:hypothetical protein n=1 Tax=Kribbella sp. NPDC058245 TaxID=3346399 RepID=UPI0036EF01D4